jgi:ribosomal protein S18 acetylase RimI-like enzyme
VTLTPALALRAVQPDEFPAWADASIARYIEDMVANAGLRRADAEAKAARDRATVLPAGVASPGQSIYFIVEPGTGDPIGRLWLGERPPALFVYEIWLAESVRGRGLGRQAMLLVEAEARRRGLEFVELNVFGGNARARQLYTSLGYQEVAIYMRKAVPAD